MFAERVTCLVIADAADPSPSVFFFLLFQPEPCGLVWSIVVENVKEVA